MDEKNTRNSERLSINDIGVNVPRAESKKVAEFPQLDEGLMAWPCRSASDTVILEKRLPENIKRSLERHKISLYDAIYYARTKKRKESRLSKTAFAEFVKLLCSMHYIRNDFTTISFAYVRLMRKANIPNDYIADVSEITDNVMYETCSVPSAGEMKAFDLVLENRLNYRSQYIIRKMYGLDDGIARPAQEVARFFNRIVMDGESREFFEHRQDFLTRITTSRVEIAKDKALKKLEAVRDDKHEYVGKLAKGLYKATRMPKEGETKVFDDALIESYASDILLTTKRF